jgi:hypothetical protein
MQTETQAATGQTDTAPVTQQSATGTGTAPVDGGQQQQTQQDQTAQQTATQTQDQQAASDTQGKTGEDGKPVVTVPEQYADFTTPEGYSLGEIGEEFKAVAKELGLTQDQAQKLIDLDVKRSTAHENAVQVASAAWLAETKADKEFGGDALAENVAVAQKAINAFGTPALKDLLQKTGLGNHPEVIRAFYRAGKTISEDHFIPANGSLGGAGDPAKTLFPNQA